MHGPPEVAVKSAVTSPSGYGAWEPWLSDGKSTRNGLRAYPTSTGGRSMTRFRCGLHEQSSQSVGRVSL